MGIELKKEGCIFIFIFIFIFFNFIKLLLLGGILKSGNRVENWKLVGIKLK
jgi:uncharacterized protein YqfA (UPF0365 family)